MSSQEAEIGWLYVRTKRANGWDNNRSPIWCVHA